VGKWKIKATNLMKVKSGYEMRCGHKLPSNKETSWKAEATYPLLYFISIFYFFLKNTIKNLKNYIYF
jgi:hypothetical protein